MPKKAQKSLIFAKPSATDSNSVLSLKAVQQSLRDAVVVAEEGDEAGRDAHDRRPRLPHLQRPQPRRQHPRGLRDQLQATH